ncbi:MAG TPA: WD40 repeat domain-containing protein [Gemmataceae bacterium]|nr:WD40 repeat domain-containing protein [Gemmataceae bacterium]
MRIRLIRYFSRFLPFILGLLTAARLLAGGPDQKPAKVDVYGDPLPPLARLRIGTTRFQHGGEIVALAFAPDGRSIATIGRDDVLHLWSTASGKALASFHAPDGVAFAFAEHGKALLWCDGRGQIYRCDAGQRGDNHDGQRQRVYRFDWGAIERIEAVAFTADGSAAVAGTSGNHISFWGRRGELLLGEGIQAVALDRDGQRLAVNNGHKGFYLQKVSNSRQAREPLCPFDADAVRSLAFSPDGQMLAAGDFDNRIRLWNVSSGDEARLLKGHRQVPVRGKNGVFCLAFSPDGARLASGAADGIVRIWDVKSGKELACCAGHGDRVRALAFAPDGKCLASAGADNALRLWDPANGRAIGPLPQEGGAVVGMSVAPDGRTLALVQLPGRLRLWDAATGKELPRMPKGPAAVAAVFTPKGDLIFASDAGHLHFWDCGKMENQREPQNVPTSIRLLAAANDGATVAWCGNDHRVILWDARAGKQLRQLRPQGNKIAELVFSPDGETLFVADLAGVHVFTLQEKPTSRDLAGGSGGVFAAAVSPDGRILATGGRGGAVRLWETASGQERRAMFGDAAFVRSAAFSADGTLLATGGSNGVIRLWDVAGGQRLHSFAGHRGAVIAVAFTGHDSTLITASVDGTALVWDLPALLKAGRAKVIELSDQQVQALWRDLASEAAPRAYEAVDTLARAPAQAVPFLRQHVTPVSEDNLARRIEELDSDEYKTRVRAMNELARMGKFAEPKLRKLLTEKPSLEVRRRTEELLSLLDNPSATTEHLRVLRAVEVLERIGTDSARQALQALAEGAASAGLTREAKAALTRLSRKGK